MSLDLLNKLTELVPDNETAQMVVDIAGLPTSKIDFSGAPKTMWHKILREAKKHNDGILKIINSVLDDYPDDEELLDIKTKLQSMPLLEEDGEGDEEPNTPQVGIDGLKTLIAQNKIDETLKKLSEIGKTLDSNFQNQVISFKASYSRLQGEKMKGTISSSVYNLEMNKLRYSLLEFIDSIDI